MLEEIVNLLIKVIEVKLLSVFLKFFQSDCLNIAMGGNAKIFSQNVDINSLALAHSAKVLVSE